MSKNHKSKQSVDIKKIIKSPVNLLAFGLGLGFMPIAPGTFGTLLGVIIYIITNYYLELSNIVNIIFIIFAFIIGLYLCGKTAKDINYHDHPGIVWDEVVGYLITMLFLPFNTLSIMLGFLCFRFFDILKPWPIKQVDQKIDGGFGIMFDDVLAGIYANVTMQLIFYFI